MTDGFGAQGIRVMGIFSIARFFRLGYLHNPISEISDINELVGTTGRHSEFQQILAELNEYIKFPQDNFPTQNSNFVDIYNLGFRKLLYFGMIALIFRKSIILRICLPFGITDRMPIINYYGKKVLGKSKGSKLNSISHKRVVVVHIRASEHSPDKIRQQLGPIYYKNVLNQVAEQFKGEFHLIVHTDFHLSDFGASGKTKRVKAFEPFLQECESMSNSEVNHYADIRKVIFDMTHADVLVMSRSALPYLAGLLSGGEIVFPKCHGHSPLRGWIIQDCADFIFGV